MKSATRTCGASVDENAETRAYARVYAAMTIKEFLQTRGIAEEIERDLAMVYLVDRQLLYLKR
jgi:hypothetical protein